MKKESLHTRDRKEAQRLCNARNEAAAVPERSLALGLAYLSGNDSKMSTRTWSEVFEEYCSNGKEPTQFRKRSALKGAAFKALEKKRIIETTSDDFLAVAKNGAAAQMHLRCIQNLALGLGWLPRIILPKKCWPKVGKKTKRGITLEEHEKILTAEHNPIWRLYYQILWETGAAQTDGANLRAENIDWESRTLAYQRQKSGEWACLRIGERLADILKQLPSTGLLFPSIALRNDSGRAWHFSKVRARAGVNAEVTLHSYRYAWAERAKACGYPERWAQNALGHASKAVHQAYARGGVAVCPPMEEYEGKVVLVPAFDPKNQIENGQPLSNPML